ncbi:hypothetical protein A3D03_02240 [Candidatus Gottesmanbacteria bacterium RIFCSPHIGHO2_02_FULL_40_13]|uniref:Double zinc ribbon domain-containing protein n=1 Tax=Candidatus Gottesmanbacteria bacterium RIFCSPHIGHO2_02_FULL_40_13 TaxID=1798384 RepID=A0A1F6A716_9BACT|nr:MAG: hypothetical protein A3D03_02240 [Candidatus Gottesmanbacteria bacterium RIFCSPHIGHO2_02_FULL_40_13]
MNFLDLIFPRRCVGCNKLGAYLCLPCINKIEYIEKPICPVCGKRAIDGATHPHCQGKYSLDGLFAVAHFRGVVKDAIHLIKYRFVSDLIESMSDLLISNWSKTLPEFDYLIPVPLHSQRLKSRGFNQSSLLSHYIGKKLDIAVKEKILFRKINTTAQADLKLKERLKNLEDVFMIRDETDLSGRKIALIDDVTTTRSTFLECAKPLKQHGAEIVWGIAIAHG